MEVISLLATVASVILLLLTGVLIGRRWKVAMRAAAYAVPLLLVLSLSILAAYGERVFVLWGFASWIVAVLGVLETGATILSAWLPGRISFGLGGMMGALGFFLSAISAFSTHSLESLTAVACYGLLAAAGFMGAVSRRIEESEEGQPPLVRQEKENRQEEIRPQGCLTFFSGIFSGQKIPISGSEEIRIGSDAASCHLILDVPGTPACLCRVCWLEKRNTYLITSGPQGGLSFGDGTALPPGGSMEVWSGTILYWRETEEPAFRLGQRREQEDESD